MEPTHPPKTCFIICPIGEENTEIRKNSDLFFKYVIQPVVEKLNYAPIRADHMNESGMIKFQIIDKIITSPLVIADLTNNNPNVFYELAVRHAMKKPCVLMKTEGQETPFDIDDMRIISYDLKNPEKVEEARKRLYEQIKNMDNSVYKYLNPITLAYTYKNLARSLADLENTEDDILTLILGSIAEFNSTVNEMRKEVSNLNGTFSFLDSLGLPSIFKESGTTYEEMADVKIAQLKRELKEKSDLNKKGDDPLLRDDIERIKREIRRINGFKKSPDDLFFDL
ncbi:MULTISPECIES: hypothetical protein [unclassified Methanosarcina]|uniref:hypothetical protein n=1 Tax=unclassified Methanosarcina TaxID=2644672 RepID=UPI0006155018|nr:MULTISPECIES: hypothetical protein [unclassified Methanosarcina]AKB17529.1 hypothetical protein MSWHS_0666 [Methanosarcina sp. WWM596]AKB20916.1 hypothetical protein MSWH1_0645 [Methanosarcina sp. WH1]